METKVVMFDGVPLVVPIIYGVEMEFAHPTFKGYPTKCGAGEGIGDKVVPETILFLPVSPDCHIHDNMWDIAEPTWDDFHYSNSVFLNNIMSTIRHKSSNFIIEHLRNYRAITYYNAVNTIGADIFWNLKEKQGEDISGRYYVDLIRESVPNGVCYDYEFRGVKAPGIS